MTVTPDSAAPGNAAPAIEGTFDARERHKGAFSFIARTDREIRRRPQPVLIACAAWLTLVVLAAIFAAVLPIKSPSVVIGAPNLAPSWTGEFLGTDAIGRSMISRLAYGAQVSLEISVFVTVVAAVAGGGVGLLATYFRGAVGFAADTIANTILSIPGLLLLLAIVVVLSPSLPVLVGAIAVLYFPGFMRVTRATAISLIEREYVVAARSLGASQWRIIARELLPNTAVALITYAMIVLPSAMLAEGSLSYLGFGVQPPTPSWGQMIAQGQSVLNLSPWGAVVPCIIFSITVFSLYSLGDWLRARLDVRGSASS
ncbi:MAG TPA: ABC transporter permease [Trebonia sp.]|jgi:peptide/nickel transport system permease protein|nr:ABC transporter permease [Trebonia sp.]